MGLTSEQRNRLNLRVEEFKNCKTSEELSLVIWSKKFEELSGSNKESYRYSFVEWVEAKKNGTKSNWKYETTIDLVEGIYPRFSKDDKDEWIETIRKTIVDWLDKYINELPV